MRAVAVRAAFLLSFCFIFSVAEFPNETVFWTSRTNILYYSSSISSWISSSQKPVFNQLSLTGSQSSNGIAFDIPRRWIITSDAKRRTLILSDLMMNISTFLLTGTSKDVGQLTVDWKARNLYWADEGFGWIAMKALPDKSNAVNGLDTNFKLVIDKYLDMPTAIVVHPEKHYLFWADAGKSPKIERSDLVGQNRTLIVWQSLISPTSLCIDSSTNRLYWSDPQRGTVEYSLFDGSSRKIFTAQNDYDYYGLAVFQNALLFTSPNNNITGLLSLNKNQEGERLNYDLKLDVVLYEIAAFDTTLQPRNELEGCDTEFIGCDQICVHMPVDRGGTCFCQDGYDLERDGKTCTATGKVLERYLMFTNGNQICAVPISVLGLNTYLAYYCDSVTSTSSITRFSLDMTHKKVFYTDGKEIFQQTAFNHTTKSLVYATNGTIIDMDYDWKTKYLYWVETNDRYIYYKNVGDDFDGTVSLKATTSLDVTTIAVDPHNSKIFWIAKTDEIYTLNVWDLLKEEMEMISTSLLSTPTDLEYDRLNNRLVWNDDAGFIGMIKTDGREETKVDASPSGKSKNALTVYKHFIISTSGDNRQFTILYDLDYDVEEHLNLSYWNGDPVQDVHVYESILQPSDLEICEVDNGGCDHICLPVGDRRCACYLGYDLDTDGRSCKAGVLDSNFYVAIDRLHKSLYQIDRTNHSTYKIQIDPSNEPVSMAFDFLRGHVIWTDAKSSTVKKKSLDKTNEKAIITTASTDVEWTPSIAVDVATGNIYVTERKTIVVVGPQNDKLIVVSSTLGTIGKLALKSENGKMAWFETGATSRIVIANMDGTDQRAMPSSTMKAPADIVFDGEKGSYVYWCDRDLDKIEKIDTELLVSTKIYSGRDLKPVSLDIVDNYIYLTPKDQRQIVRIDKVTGGSQEIVFESPLFGTFNDFFVSRDSIKGHSVCGNCNGECSNLCLPKGFDRSCACNDGDSLSFSHGTICKKSAVCNVDEYLGFSALKDCCTNLPNAVCRPTCQSGFSLSVSGAVACSSGRWNVSLENICENPSKKLPIVAIAAGTGGGGAALVIMIVVVVVISRRKSGGNKPSVDEPDDPRYATAVGGLSPTPPPRPTVEEGEGEDYDYLKEDEMIDVSKLRVDLRPMPPDEKMKADGMDRRGSSASGRYSKFPERDYNDGYLTASFTHGVRKDDYHRDTHQGFPVTRKDSGSGVSNPAFILDSNGGTSVRYDARADREMYDIRREQLAGYMQLTDSSRSMMSQPAPSRHRVAAGDGSQSSGYTTRIQRR